jgi:hypothetical protein
MILEQIPCQISARASHESELAYQVDHSLTRLKELVFLVHLERISMCSVSIQLNISTSRILKAALLLSPCTLASLAKKSLP